MGKCSTNSRWNSDKKKKFKSIIVPNNIENPSKENIQKTINKLMNKIRTQKEYSDFHKFEESLGNSDDALKEIYINQDKINESLDILSNIYKIDEPLGEIPPKLTISTLYWCNTADYMKLKKLGDLGNYIWNIKFTMYNIDRLDYIDIDIWNNLMSRITINNSRNFTEEDIIKLSKMCFTTCKDSIYAAIKENIDDFSVKSIIHFMKSNEKEL